VLEQPTVNMFIDHAFNEEAHQQGTASRKRSMLQCIQNPSGHCPCSPARAACVDAQGVSHGGMRSCSLCYDQCECGLEYDTSKQANPRQSRWTAIDPTESSICTRSFRTAKIFFKTLRNIHLTLGYLL
jgi:hypothetical protein